MKLTNFIAAFVLATQVNAWVAEPIGRQPDVVVRGFQSTSPVTLRSTLTILPIGQLERETRCSKACAILPEGHEQEPHYLPTNYEANNIEDHAQDNLQKYTKTNPPGRHQSLRPRPRPQQRPPPRPPLAFQMVSRVTFQILAPAADKSVSVTGGVPVFRKSGLWVLRMRRGV